jgi:hypothetical protein
MRGGLAQTLPQSASNSCRLQPRTPLLTCPSGSFPFISASCISSLTLLPEGACTALVRGTWADAKGSKGEARPSHTRRVTYGKQGTSRNSTQIMTFEQQGLNTQSSVRLELSHAHESIGGTAGVFCLPPPRSNSLGSTADSSLLCSGVLEP